MVNYTKYCAICFSIIKSSLVFNYKIGKTFNLFVLRSAAIAPALGLFKIKLNLKVKYMIVALVKISKQDIMMSTLYNLHITVLNVHLFEAVLDMAKLKKKRQNIFKCSI